MTDTWTGAARYSSFSPETDIQLSGSPNYGNGKLTGMRTLSDQSGIEAFKDRHARLLATENEKNKLIEVRLQYSLS